MKRSSFSVLPALLVLLLVLAGCGSGHKSSGASTSKSASGGAGDTEYSDPFGTSNKTPGGKGAAGTQAAKKLAAAALILEKAATPHGAKLVAPAAPAVKAWVVRFKTTPDRARSELKTYAAQSGWTLGANGSFSHAK